MIDGGLAGATTQKWHQGGGWQYKGADSLVGQKSRRLEGGMTGKLRHQIQTSRSGKPPTMTPGGWEDARDVPVTAGRRGTEYADKRVGEWERAGLCSRESRALAKGRRGRQGGGRCSGRAWNGGGRDLLWRGGWWNRALVETRGCSSKQLPVGERRVKEEGSRRAAGGWAEGL